MTHTRRDVMAFSLFIVAFCGAVFAAQKQPPKPKPDPAAALDDVAKWPARDFANATAIQCPVIVYIKDPGPKSNKDAGLLEGANYLGNADAKTKLRGFTRIKIKNDASNAKGWPVDWLKAAEGGAVLVLFSSDKSKIFPFAKSTPKKDFTKENFMETIDTLLKYEADKRSVAEAKRKEEEAKNPDNTALPGLDPLKKPPEEKKPKPKPQDALVENE